MNWIKKNLVNLILIAIFLTGVGLILYPTVADYWNKFHQSRAIAGYAETVAEMNNEDYTVMLEAAEAYNENLAENGIRWVMSDDQLAEYNSTLNIGGTGIMGYIEIDKINCYLPIYHGTDEGVLQIAIGHIEGSSLPVGGESTHCVLSGHRGLPSAKLFTDLDQMEKGDTFVIRTLDEVLTYEVDDIRIVLPDEVDTLGIVEGEDLCTLVTCTPYGVNTHRLLVTGHRVENQKSAIKVRVTSEAMQIEPIIIAPMIAIPILLILIIFVLVKTSADRRDRIRRKKTRERLDKGLTITDALTGTDDPQNGKKESTEKKTAKRSRNESTAKSRDKTEK